MSHEIRIQSQWQLLDCTCDKFVRNVSAVASESLAYSESYLCREVWI